MRWRKAAAAGGAALGAAALYNVTASHRIAALDNLLASLQAQSAQLTQQLASLPKITGTVGGST